VRDAVVVSLAGPVANAALAVLAGMPLRLPLPAEPILALRVFVFTNLTLAVFHLMPIPGLDGARIVATALPPRPREVYRGLDQYLPLFVILVYFLFSAPLFSIVSGLTAALCRAVAGTGGC
jgi:Zn-dependent protease